MRRSRTRAQHASLEAVCPDGLLCALALDPCSVPRNRHFLLYTAPAARSAHRKAGMLRRLRLSLLEMIRAGHPTLEVEQLDDGLKLSYRDSSLSLERSLALGVLESSLLRCMLGHEGVGLLAAHDDDRARVRAALRRIDARFGIDPARLVD